MPSTQKSRNLKRQITFDSACALLESALTGTTRQDIVAALTRAKDNKTALSQLRTAMRGDLWRTAGQELNLEKIVNDYDSQTRHDGFHVLRDWDGVADTVNEDTIPVDVLNFLLHQQGDEPPDPVALAILVDYYFVYMLALLSLKIWDGDNADGNLDRLNRLLAELQGPNGSGQQFSGNAETLMLIATSHYELDEPSYDSLLDRVRTLSQPHRMNVALGHAAALGSHLRFGFEATYARDTVKMRNDNIVDYPWLSFSLATLMDEYARMHDGDVRGEARDRIVEAMLNGLSPDARAFAGTHPPASLAGCEAERSAFRARLHDYRKDLLEEFESFRPTDQTYSPLALFFNFSHNVLKGAVVDALLCSDAWKLTLNDLFSGVPLGGPQDESKRILATTLMSYARSSPNRIRGKLMPVIVYDPWSGRQAFSVTLRKIAE
jgi:hypothetical protein